MGSSPFLVIMRSGLNSLDMGAIWDNMGQHGIQVTWDNTG